MSKQNTCLRQYPYQPSTNNLLLSLYYLMITVRLIPWELRLQINLQMILVTCALVIRGSILCSTKNISSLPVATVEGPAHAQWSARADSPTLPTILTQPCRFLHHRSVRSMRFQFYAFSIYAISIQATPAYKQSSTITSYRHHVNFLFQTYLSK
jgi:hypothetical protein